LVAFGAVLGAALAVRIVAAVRKSLVLDELHTWFHATQTSCAAFFETLRLDNHPPLGFVLVAGARLAVGTSELALRTPALVSGMLELALLAWIGTRTLGPKVGLAAALLLAASSLHVDLSSQARMYALHALAATVTLCATHALLVQERARGAAWALGSALAIWFHTHYFGGQYVLCLGLAVLALGAFDTSVRARLGRFVMPVVGATLVSLPWAYFGFIAQFQHRLPPGGDDVSLTGFAEALVHLFFLNIRLGGDALRLAFIASGGLLLVLGAAGALALWRDPRHRVLGALLATCAFIVPVEAWIVANVAPRSGFTWHYLLPSAAPLALLAAAGACGTTIDAVHAWPRALRRALVGAFVLVTALAALLTGLNVATRGTEDFRSAVAALLALHEDGDAVISVEWQPTLFPQGQPYEYYASRLREDPPPRLPMREFWLADVGDLDGVSRVLMMSKSLPTEQHLMQQLRKDFDVVERRSFGWALDVYVWQRR
jgi:4-amino-4-deoxy-L-arabinose transferase-like glycosyltransferase